MTDRAEGAFRHVVDGERVIGASTDAVWAVLSDFHGVDGWAPRVTRVVATSDTARGVGMARHCDIRGLGGVDEVVDVWEEGRRLGYSVSPVGPIGAAQSLWELAPTARGATRVRLRLSYDLRFGALGALLHVLLVRRLLAANLPGALLLLERRVVDGPAGEASKPPRRRFRRR